MNVRHIICTSYGVVDAPEWLARAPRRKDGRFNRRTRLGRDAARVTAEIIRKVEAYAREHDGELPPRSFLARYESVSDVLYIVGPVETPFSAALVSA